MNVSSRGVWHITWGAKHSSVLLAVDSHDELITDPIVIPPQIDPQDISSQLWDALDKVDPGSVTGRPPSFARVRRSKPREAVHLHLSRGGR